jgi:hypothetical protein
MPNVFRYLVLLRRMNAWLEPIDAVRRRINRRKLMPDHEARPVRAIREHFPEVEL